MQRLKDFLRGVRAWFFAQKYRFMLGITFLTFINFALLVVTASDKLKHWLGIVEMEQLLAFMLVAAFLAVWAFGFFLDVIVKAQAQDELQSWRRSPIWKKNFDDHAAIYKELRELRAVLRRSKGV